MHIKFNKKIKSYLKISNFTGLFLCLTSLLFTYYYFLLFSKPILLTSLFLFEAGLAITVGSIISVIIISNQ